MNNDIKDSKNDNFQAMMEARIRENFTAPVKNGKGVSDERLKEMNKKLPKWSLEPPYSFLR